MVPLTKNSLAHTVANNLKCVAFLHLTFYLTCTLHCYRKRLIILRQSPNVIRRLEVNIEYYCR